VLVQGRFDLGRHYRVRLGRRHGAALAWQMREVALSFSFGKASGSGTRWVQ
jgi:hypothetical protein